MTDAPTCDAVADQPTSARRGRFIATVAANHAICREHNKLTFRLDAFPPSRPGQFVQVKCRDVDGAPIGRADEAEHDWPPTSIGGHVDLTQPTPVLRRPFSLAGRRDLPDGGVELDLINRDIGPGTHWLSTLAVGQEVDLIGPLGVGFELPPPGGVALLVGGGVGIPPMIYVAQALAELNRSADKGSRRKAVAFAGALSRDLLSLTITDAVPEAPAGQSAESMMPLDNIVEFATFGVPTIVSTDNGSYGWHGRITEPLAKYIDAFFGDSWEVGSHRPTIYTCGPEPMMKAVAALAIERGIACQVAVERAMACGMGTCQSCVIREAADNERGWVYKLACTDGPVFEAGTLLW